MAAQNNHYNTTDYAKVLVKVTNIFLYLVVSGLANVSQAFQGRNNLGIDPEPLKTTTSWLCVAGYSRKEIHKRLWGCFVICEKPLFAHHSNLIIIYMMLRLMLLPPREKFTNNHFKTVPVEFRVAPNRAALQAGGIFFMDGQRWYTVM